MVIRRGYLSENLAADPHPSTSQQVMYPPSPLGIAIIYSKDNNKGYMNLVYLIAFFVLYFIVINVFIGGLVEGQPSLKELNMKEINI